MIFSGQPGWPEPSSPSAVSGDCSGKQPKALPETDLRNWSSTSAAPSDLSARDGGHTPGIIASILGALGTVTKVHLTQLMPAFAGNLVILQKLTTNNRVVKGGLRF